MSTKIYTDSGSGGLANTGAESDVTQNSMSSPVSTIFNEKKNPLVYCSLMLDGKPFLDKSSFSLELGQLTNDHDSFSITVPDDSLDSFEGYVMENSKNILGKNISISFHRFGLLQQSFTGIITNIKNKKENGYGTLNIIGKAPSILLENGKTCQSFENKTLEDIVKEATQEHEDINIVIENLNTQYILPYTVQYKESDYQFLKRLAVRYGEYFYFNGQQMIFGNNVQSTVRLEENIDLIEVEFEINVKPQNFEYTVYDANKGINIEAGSSSSHLQYKENPLQAIAINASKEVYKKKQPMLFNYSGISGIAEKELKEAVKKEKESRENLVSVRGKSKDPAVRIGGKIQLIDINGKAMETYRITNITHYHDGNIYYNEFGGIPDLYIAPYLDGEAVPVGEQQSARVVDNNDPLGAGRVRVQFPWQKKKGSISPWLRLIQPNGGSGKGFHFIPETGEEVAVGFESDNAEKPYVMGSQYNGAEKSGYATENNNNKVIQTRSGSRVLFNDKDGSVTINDPGNNSVVFDGMGNVTITALNSITLNAGQAIILSAGANISLTTVNMKQNISDSIDTTAKEISSVVEEKIEISAKEISTQASDGIKMNTKELALNANEKLTMHSDKEVVVNAQSQVGIKGGKISMDNKPEGAGKQDKKSEEPDKKNDQSKSAAKAPETAAKTALDKIAELKQDAKDVIDRLISTGELIVAIKEASSKDIVQKKVETTTQTATGTETESTVTITES
ncbi:type VI secretion system tip protein VgrG [Chryseobacterium rhizoplanae]|uniref:type VI secretion system Vgr family protein n=1 Tax=Chryseobacterium rhizoplanae TaxID=1609531 RepID=UPI001CE30EC5|nr:type VI secretion system tip protein VgrG [Chryseobacterium rhizoplanae]UCA61762.1 type VI secretion system tip protein VgrG [Chryseobacterium rhizoplanae]